MDQIRTILRVLWQQRFWVLSSVGTLVAVLCWWLASGDLDKEFIKNKGTIDGKFSAMRTLVNAPVLPNDDVNQEDEQQTKLLQESVLKLWDELYQRQRQVVLFWPKDNLHAEFIEAIDKLHFGDPFPANKAVFMRNNYLNYIENRFDGLVEIVKARKVEGRGGRFGRGPEGLGGEGGFGMRAFNRGGPETEDEDYLVQWLDQDNLRSQLDFPTQPTDLQIWVTQENLWVYETLLNVIANTNKQRGATRPDNTAVRIISALEVGRTAAQASRQPGTIMIPQAAGDEGGFGGRGMEGGRGGYEGGEMGGYPGGEMGRGFEGGRGMGEYGSRGEGSVDVLSHRYVDAEGVPIEGGDPQDLGIEFRRLPVRMVLTIDQRWIQQVLIECANAALPVEVKRLRINPNQSGASFNKASSGSRSAGMRGRTPADGVMDDTGMVEVEIQGVVYIYNEPNRERLEVPGIESI